MNRRLLASLLVALGLLVVPASSSAKVNIAVGIGDQSPTMFDDANWKALSLKKTRYFIEWNAVDQPEEILAADEFVTRAQAAGVKVLLHISTDDINATPRKPLPSVSAYRQKVGLLVKYFKSKGVTEWGVWNEANHSSQPTNRNPKRAAQFFTEMRKLCKGCTIVALDVLDQAGVQKYIKQWFAALGKANARNAKIIGIHNYSEVNRKLKKGSKTYPGTQRIIDAALEHNRRAKFWYTETGGLVKLGSGFPCDPSRAGDRTSYMFKLAKKFRKYIQRLYTYNWTPTPTCDDSTRFDAGVVNPDGTPRPAYNVIKSQLANYKR